MGSDVSVVKIGLLKWHSTLVVSMFFFAPFSPNFRRELDNN